jgi:hypothetical protein
MMLAAGLVKASLLMGFETYPGKNLLAHSLIYENRDRVGSRSVSIVTLPQSEIPLIFEIIEPCPGRGEPSTPFHSLSKAPALRVSDRREIIDGFLAGLNFELYVATRALPALRCPVC